MLAHPLTELVARAPCQLRRAHARSIRPSGPRARVSASSAALYEVDKTRKRDVQTGGPTGAVESDAHAGTFLPEVREFITISGKASPNSS
jgi:hypothetical protein